MLSEASQQDCFRVGSALVHETLRQLLYEAHKLVALAKATRDNIADAGAPTDIETQVQFSLEEQDYRFLCFKCCVTVAMTLSQ